MSFYERLGFDAQGHGRVPDRGSSGRIAPLFHSPSLDPWSSDAACYLYVDNVDAVFAEFSALARPVSGIPRLHGEPSATDYGIRGFALVDPEGKCASVLRCGDNRAAVLLAIDVGNTQTHVGTFRDDELVEHWRYATARFATADELASGLAGLLALREMTLRDVEAAMVSSVVPTLAHEFERVIERYFAGRGALVGPSLRTGMPIRIDRPQELGADRLVNAVAAFDRVGGACVAVDFGTAINYDVVSSAGEYLGGVISPGIEISLEALGARAARLPRVEISRPRHAIGKGTEEAIQAGVVYGFAGQVDGILGRLREELGEEATAIATGGYAAAIVPFCDQVDEVDDLLTLRGLKLIWERNSDP